MQENIFEEVFPEYFVKFLAGFIRCEYMPRLYSHPLEYMEKLLMNYLCIGFVPGGNLETWKGAEFPGSYSSLEDWDADLDPCNFTTTHLTACILETGGSYRPRIKKSFI